MENLKKNYDKDLQMFAETPKEPNPGKLAFYRWMAEEGRLEHPVSGDPIGPFVDLVNGYTKPNQENGADFRRVTVQSTRTESEGQFNIPALVRVRTRFVDTRKARGNIAA